MLRDALNTGTNPQDIKNWFDSNFLPVNSSEWIVWGGRTVGTLNVYGKTVLAGWMTTNSIDYDAPTLIGFALPNHSNIDYLASARAGGNVFHDRFRYHHNQSYDAYGRFNSLIGKPDYIDMYCPIYDGDKSNDADPIVRAGVMVHEGWHSWEKTRGIRNDSTVFFAEDPSTVAFGLTPAFGDSYHYFAPLDATACRNLSTIALRFHKNGPCDVWYDHRGRKPAGKMHEQIHSGYQAEAEFLCDVIDRPTYTVQQISKITAANRGNGIALNNFANHPGPTCGTPTPIIGVNPLPTCSTPQTSCTADVDCAADHPGDICSGGCCSAPILAPVPGLCDTQSCVNTSDCEANFPGFTCLTVNANGQSADCCVPFIH